VTQTANPAAPEKGGSLPWYALHVRSNQELKVRDALRGQALEEFLPTYTVQRGKETITRALLPGYCFARFDCRRRLPIMQISGMITILGTHVGPIVIAEHEVEHLRQICKAPEARPAARMDKGQRVRIKYGAMVGCEGTVEHQQGPCRVRVIVDALFGRSVAVQVEREALEAI
jgi:transcription antitermination factor NusG